MFSFFSQFRPWREKRLLNEVGGLGTGAEHVPESMRQSESAEGGPIDNPDHESRQRVDDVDRKMRTVGDSLTSSDVDVSITMDGGEVDTQLKDALLFPGLDDADATLLDRNPLHISTTDKTQLDRDPLHISTTDKRMGVAPVDMPETYASGVPAVDMPETYASGVPAVDMPSHKRIEDPGPGGEDTGEDPISAVARMLVEDPGPANATSGPAANVGDRMRVDPGMYKDLGPSADPRLDPGFTKDVGPSADPNLDPGMYKDPDKRRKPRVDPATVDSGEEPSGPGSPRGGVDGAPRQKKGPAEGGETVEESPNQELLSIFEELTKLENPARAAKLREAIMSVPVGRAKALLAVYKAQTPEELDTFNALIIRNTEVLNIASAESIDALVGILAAGSPAERMQMWNAFNANLKPRQRKRVAKIWKAEDSTFVADFLNKADQTQKQQPSAPGRLAASGTGRAKSRPVAAPGTARARTKPQPAPSSSNNKRPKPETPAPAEKPVSQPATTPEAAAEAPETDSKISEALQARLDKEEQFLRTIGRHDSSGPTMRRWSSFEKFVSVAEQFGSDPNDLARRMMLKIFYGDYDKESVTADDVIAHFSKKKQGCVFYLEDGVMYEYDESGWFAVDEAVTPEDVNFNDLVRNNPVEALRLLSVPPIEATDNRSSRSFIARFKDVYGLVALAQEAHDETAREQSTPVPQAPNVLMADVEDSADQQEEMSTAEYERLVADKLVSEVERIRKLSPDELQRWLQDTEELQKMDESGLLAAVLLAIDGQADEVLEGAELQRGVERIAKTGAALREKIDEGNQLPLPELVEKMKQEYASYFKQEGLPGIDFGAIVDAGSEEQIRSLYECCALEDVIRDWHIQYGAGFKYKETFQELLFSNTGDCNIVASLYASVVSMSGSPRLRGRIQYLDPVGHSQILIDLGQVHGKNVLISKNTSYVSVEQQADGSDEKLSEVYPYMYNFYDASYDYNRYGLHHGSATTGPINLVRGEQAEVRESPEYKTITIDEIRREIVFLDQIILADLESGIDQNNATELQNRLQLTAQLARLLKEQGQSLTPAEQEQWGELLDRHTASTFLAADDIYNYHKAVGPEAAKKHVNYYEQLMLTGDGSAISQRFIDFLWQPQLAIDNMPHFDPRIQVTSNTITTDFENRMQLLDSIHVCTKNPMIADFCAKEHAKLEAEKAKWIPDEEDS